MVVGLDNHQIYSFAKGIFQEQPMAVRVTNLFW